MGSRVPNRDPIREKLEGEPFQRSDGVVSLDRFLSVIEAQGGKGCTKDMFKAPINHVSWDHTYIKFSRDHGDFPQDVPKEIRVSH